MKAKLIVIGLFLAFLICIIVCFARDVLAETYLLINKTTNEVQDMSVRDDAVVEAGFEKIVLPGKITDYELQYHPQYYKYVGGKWILNIKKISDEELIKEASVQKLNKEKQDKQSAKEKLKALGLTKDEADAIIK
jgi:hypothetical protein